MSMFETLDSQHQGEFFEPVDDDCFEDRIALRAINGIKIPVEAEYDDNGPRLRLTKIKKYGIMPNEILISSNNLNITFKLDNVELYTLIGTKVYHNATLTVCINKTPIFKINKALLQDLIDERNIFDYVNGELAKEQRSNIHSNISVRQICAFIHCQLYTGNVEFISHDRALRPGEMNTLIEATKIISEQGHDYIIKDFSFITGREENISNFRTFPFKNNFVDPKNPGDFKNIRIIDATLLRNPHEPVRSMKIIWGAWDRYIEPKSVPDFKSVSYRRTVLQEGPGFFMLYDNPDWIAKYNYGPYMREHVLPLLAN